MSIQLYDAGDGVICVDFKRKSGSSMVLYDQFNILRDRISPVGEEEEAKE